ncbi:hypothetical protein GCM10018954_061370 [Kutzneria kofuensis]
MGGLVAGEVLEGEIVDGGGLASGGTIDSGPADGGTIGGEVVAGGGAVGGEVVAEGAWPAVGLGGPVGGSRPRAGQLGAAVARGGLVEAAEAGVLGAPFVGRELTEASLLGGVVTGGRPAEAG